MKKQLPLVYMETFKSISRTKIQHTRNVFILFTTIETLNYVQFYISATPLWAVLGFSDTLGHIFLTDAQNKSR